MVDGVVHYHGIGSGWKKVCHVEEEGGGQVEDGATGREEEKGGC